MRIKLLVMILLHILPPPCCSTWHCKARTCTKAQGWNPKEGVAYQSARRAGKLHIGSIRCKITNQKH